VGRRGGPEGLVGGENWGPPRERSGDGARPLPRKHCVFRLKWRVVVNSEQYFFENPWTICISVPPFQLLGARSTRCFPVIYADGWRNPVDTNYHAVSTSLFHVYQRQIQEVWREIRLGSGDRSPPVRSRGKALVEGLRSKSQKLAIFCKLYYNDVLNLPLMIYFESYLWYPECITWHNSKSFYCFEAVIGSWCFS